MATRKPTPLDLHKAIEAVAPIEGVSRKGNTARIDYQEGATAKQRRAAEAILAAWDWQAEIEDPPTDTERIAALELLVAKLQADIDALKNAKK